MKVALLCRRESPRKLMGPTPLRENLYSQSEQKRLQSCKSSLPVPHEGLNESIFRSTLPFRAYSSIEPFFLGSSTLARSLTK